MAESAQQKRNHLNCFANESWCSRWIRTYQARKTPSQIIQQAIEGTKQKYHWWLVETRGNSKTSEADWQLVRSLVEGIYRFWVEQVERLLSAVRKVAKQDRRVDCICIQRLPSLALWQLFFNLLAQRDLRTLLRCLYQTEFAICPSSFGPFASCPSVDHLPYWNFRQAQMYYTVIEHSWWSEGIQIA